MLFVSCRFDSGNSYREVFRITLDPHKAETLTHSGYAGRTGASERVKHDSVFRGDESDKPAHDSDRFYGRMMIPDVGGCSSRARTGGLCARTPFVAVYRFRSASGG